jgi:chemotaxis protein CheD
MGPDSFLDFAEKWQVGIGELAVSNDPNVVLATVSLGSCLAISMYDPAVKVGGLLRALLPEGRAEPDRAERCPGLFVDTGLAALLRALAPYGVERPRLHVCLAGAADCLGAGTTFNLGQRNLQTARELLQRYHLPVHAAAVGGVVSRSIFLDVGTGTVRVFLCGQPTECHTLWSGSTNS